MGSAPWVLSALIKCTVNCEIWHRLPRPATGGLAGHSFFLVQVALATPSELAASQPEDSGTAGTAQ